jgi:glycine dehydrogenase
MNLHDLEHHHEFHARHIGPNDAEIAEMLIAVGAASLDGLVDAIVPSSIKMTAPLALPGAVTEEEALAKIRTIAAGNRVHRSFIGQGYYGTVTPKVILRNILENPAWYTAYTPYQAEISQGRMEALINFQTMVADLTGMEIANASLLDEGTAAAEAMTLARRSAKSKSNVFIVAGDCHPQTIEVIRTRAEPLGIEIKVGFAPGLMKSGDYFGVLAQYPATDGLIHDMRPFVEQAHAAGALFCVATDLLALTLLEAPGKWGTEQQSADIVVGNSQRFGVPFGFGGPHAAFLACKDAFKRSMPGRLVGVSIDSQGNPAYRLTLQTREQHLGRADVGRRLLATDVLFARLQCQAIGGLSLRVDRHTDQPSRHRALERVLAGQE